MTKPSDFNSRLCAEVRNVYLTPRYEILIQSTPSSAYLELYYDGKRIQNHISVTYDRTDINGNYVIVYITSGGAYTHLPSCINDVIINADYLGETV